jgi:hypothetical protein
MKGVEAKGLAIFILHVANRYPLVIVTKRNNFGDFNFLLKDML